MLTNFPVNVKAPPAAAILEKSELVQGFFRYGARTRNPLEIFSLWWRLFFWRPEVLVYMGAARGVESARRDARFFQLCGIKRLIWVPLSVDMQENRWLGDEKALEPEAGRLCRNLAELGDGRLDDAESWDLHLTEGERRRAAEAVHFEGDRPIIAVSVGTKVQSKDWGRENWRGLLGRLASLYPGYTLALTGAPEESEASEFAADGWREVAGNEGVVNLCGVLTPRESAAVFELAKVFIGHDSGPMHLAAAVQTPCIAIFAARNKPRVWFPYGEKHRVIYHKTDCWGCGLETCIEQKKKCIVSITIDEVIAEIRAVLV